MPRSDYGWWNVSSKEMAMVPSIPQVDGNASDESDDSILLEGRALPLRPHPRTQSSPQDPDAHLSRAASSEDSASYSSTENTTSHADRAPQTGMFRPTRSTQAWDSHEWAPLFSSTAGGFLEGSTYAQYGLIGQREGISTPQDCNSLLTETGDEMDKDLIFSNVDAPWSAFICGSQGSGKSHTLSCLLENSLMPDARIGRLTHPLTGMVFHYDNFAGGSWSQVCETAYLCSLGIPVTILVAPSNIWTMTQMYTNLPGLPPDAPRPKVAPLYFPEASLDVTSILKLMAIDSTESTPLYITTVKQILLDMAMEGKGTHNFSYREFRSRLDNVNWVRGQITPLELRLQLLESFLEPSSYTRSTRPASAKDIWKFKPGGLTIVDLSGPFVDSNDACTLFGMCLSRFTSQHSTASRIIALDEAHKFLTQSGAAKVLTDDLTLIIRQQRHTGSRVIIATQEPTLSPELIDLCNATFVHRFLSPAWYDVLKKHLAGASKHESRNSLVSLFEIIVALQTGEALLFCPTSLLDVERSRLGIQTLKPLGDSYAKLRIRSRLTADGGKSVVASALNHIDQQFAIPKIEMFMVSKTVAHVSGNRYYNSQTFPPKSIPIGPRVGSRWDVRPMTGTQVQQNAVHSGSTASVPAPPSAPKATPPVASHKLPPPRPPPKVLSDIKEKARAMEAELRSQVRTFYSNKGRSMRMNAATFQELLNTVAGKFAVDKSVLDSANDVKRRLRSVADSELALCRTGK